MRIKRTMFGLMALAALLTAGLPVWVEWSGARRFLEDRLSRETGGDVRIARLSVNWLPQPHAVLADVRIDHQAFVLSVPAIRISPDLWALLRGRMVPGGLRLIRPVCEIVSPDALMHMKTDSSSPPEGLDLDVTVEEGRIMVLHDAAGRSIGANDARWSASNLRLAARLSKNEIRVEGRCRSSVADTMTLDLSLRDLPDGVRVWALDTGVHRLNLEPFWAMLEETLRMDHPVFRRVKDIIPEGRIAEGQFRFRGTDAQWRDPAQMTMAATVTGARVRIPETTLTADGVSGTLAVEKARLMGRAIEGRLGASVARGGAFDLELADGEAPRFSSEVTIDADLSALPDMLDRVMDRPAVRDDPDRFDGLAGRALIHLSLGDRLGHLRPVIRMSGIRADWFDRQLSERFTIGGGVLVIDSGEVRWDRLAGFFGKTAVRRSSGRFRFGADPTIAVETLSARIDTGALYDHLIRIPATARFLSPRLTGMDGRVDLENFQLQGFIKQTNTLTYRGTVASGGVSATLPGFADPVRISSPGLEFSNTSLETSLMTVTVADQTLTLSGRVTDPLASRPEGTVTVRGALTPSFATRLRTPGGLPDILAPRLPCDLDPLVVTLEDGVWAVSGTIRHADDQGRPIVTNGDVAVGPRSIVIRRLAMAHDSRRVEIRGEIPRGGEAEASVVSLDVRGQVRGETLGFVLEKGRHVQGIVDAELRLTWPRDGGMPITVLGQAVLEDMNLPLPGGRGLTLTQGLIRGTGTAADWRLGDLTWTRPGRPQTLTVSGGSGTLAFLPDRGARMTVEDGEVCGVSVRGDVFLPAFSMDLHAGTDRQAPLSLERLMACLGEDDTRITGRMVLDADMSGTPDMIGGGRFMLRASDGVIDKARILSRILALLDLTELFSRNPVEHLSTAGYRYDTIDISGTVTGNNIHIARAMVVGAGINFYAHGYIDLETRSLDLTVLASPFKTVDGVIDRIPVAGRILGGKNRSLLSVPLKVEGHLDDPRLRILPKSVTGLSSALVDTFVQTFRLPFVLTHELVTGKDP
ncbi:hypothetical protein JCM14469_31670 [Desulfatiferula olefinivorans]